MEKQGNQITLYNILIDQLTKYNTLIWQIPIALFVANAVILDKLSSKPHLILAVCIFNAAMIFSFYKMIVQQRAIIKSAKMAEDKLRLNYPDFLPVFKISKIRAPLLIVRTFILLDGFLFVYYIFLLFNKD